MSVTMVSLPVRTVLMCVLLGLQNNAFPLLHYEYQQEIHPHPIAFKQHPVSFTFETGGQL